MITRIPATTRTDTRIERPVYELGHHPNLIASREREKPPQWVMCDADEFIRYWLPQFEKGILPPCSDEEWERIKGLLLHGKLYEPPAVTHG